MILATPTARPGPIGARLSELAWPEVEARLTAGAVGVLPVGAAAKEHGPHLPMDTDFRQAEWLAAQLVEAHDVLVWPTLSYGYYPAFVEYPGSCSVSAEVFCELAESVLAAIHRAGARAAVIVNTGISTIGPLAQAVERWPPPGRALLANAYRGPRLRACAEQLIEQAHGSHADELETSVMLAIAPQVVAMERAPAWGERAFERALFRRDDASATNYAPDGVYGDATLASPAKGHALLAAILADLDEVLAAARA